MDFFRKNHFAVNALLFSVFFWVGAVGSFVIAQVQEGEHISLSAEKVPYLFISVASGLFFLLLLLLREQKGYKFYMRFYAWWLLLMYVAFVYLYTHIEIQEMATWQREGVTFQGQLQKNFPNFFVLSVLFLLFATPHNILLIGLSILLVYFYRVNGEKQIVNNDSQQPL